MKCLCGCESLNTGNIACIMSEDDQTVKDLRRSVRTRKPRGPIKEVPAMSNVHTEEEADVVQEEVLECPEVLVYEDFNKTDNKNKIATMYTVLSKVCDKIREMDISINDEQLSLQIRLASCQMQTDNASTVSNREGHGHKAVLYKSHFPPLRHSFSQRHHCIHRLINHVYYKGQALSYSLPHDMVAARIKH